jgi:type VI protein secretion system component Hcp
MPIKTRFAGATIIALLLAGSVAAAQSGIHSVSAQAGATVVGTLRVDNISESPTPIFGLGLSVVNTSDTTSGGGGGAGKATFSDFTITRQSDAASTQLFKFAATGQHIQKVQIDVFQTNSTNVEASYILSDVTVSGYSNDGSFEKIAFNFAKIEFLSGGARSCFDRSGNLSC